METLFSVSVTTDGKISNQPISNGKVHFVRDKSEIYFDYDDKRVCYKDIIILKLEEERKSLLAPIVNKFYYIEDTETLWRSTSAGWVQITNKLIEKTSLSEDLLKSIEKIEEFSLAEIDDIKALFDDNIIEDLEQCDYDFASIEDIKALFEKEGRKEINE